MSKTRSRAIPTQQRTAEDGGAMRALENGFAYFQLKVGQRFQRKMADKAFRAMLGCAPPPDKPCWPPTLVELIWTERDEGDESHQLRAVYERAGARERHAIDRAFQHLCGWQLQTLIEEADKRSGRLPHGLR